MSIKYSALGLLIFLSCSTRDTRTTEQAQSRDTVDAYAQNQKPVFNMDTVFMSNNVAHHFSSPDIKDTFKIKVTGQSIVDGKVEFEIVANDGALLYGETFPAYSLIGYGLDENATEEEKIDYIRSRIAEFFKEDHFNHPAISDKDQFEEDFSNKEAWFDIKSDSTAVAFTYLLGEEGFNTIAYSKKLMKTVLIFGCC